MSQLTYSLSQAASYEGVLFGQGPWDVQSRSVETAAGIGAAVAVSRGTNKDEQVVVGGTDFFGITIRSLEREGQANTNLFLYEQKQTAGILRDGSIMVTCPTGCTPGQLAFYDNTTGVIDQGTAGVGETQLDGAVWDSTAAAGGLAVLRLSSLDTTAGS